MRNFSQPIIRALRKYHQIKQTDFAPLLGITQSALSKIEAGQLELSAAQWLAVCDRFTIDPRSLFTGKIENLGERKLKVEDLTHIGGFKIPKTYQHLLGSTVRTAYPLLKFARLRMGESRYEEFLKSTGFDLDYFLIMNNPLNLKFMEHLVHFLLTEKALNLENVSSVLELSQFKDSHSFILSDLNPESGLDQAVKKLLSRVKTGYELNTQYAFIGDKDYVEAKDSDFVAEFNLSKEFEVFRRSYNHSHFMALDQFVTGGQNKFKVKENSKGWMIQKIS